MPRGEPGLAIGDLGSPSSQQRAAGTHTTLHIKSLARLAVSRLGRGRVLFRATWVNAADCLLGVGTLSSPFSRDASTVGLRGREIGSLGQTTRPSMAPMDAAEL